MIYVVIFILGGMFGAMLMALSVATGTPDDDELTAQYWKDIDEYTEDEDDPSNQHIRQG